MIAITATTTVEESFSIISVHTCQFAHLLPTRSRAQIGAVERTMKDFLIKFRLTNGPEERWHQDIARFISALDDDPALSGKISYRCLKGRGGSDYYHLAAAAGEQATQALRSREFPRATPNG
jgi:hypothetical protein